MTALALLIAESDPGNKDHRDRTRWASRATAERGRAAIAQLEHLRAAHRPLRIGEDVAPDHGEAVDVVGAVGGPLRRARHFGQRQHAAAAGDVRDGIEL